MSGPGAGQCGSVPASAMPGVRHARPPPCPASAMPGVGLSLRSFHTWCTGEQPLMKRPYAADIIRNSGLFAFTGPMLHS